MYDEPPKRVLRNEQTFAPFIGKLFPHRESFSIKIHVPQTTAPVSTLDVNAKPDTSARQCHNNFSYKYFASFQRRFAHQFVNENVRIGCVKARSRFASNLFSHAQHLYKSRGFAFVCSSQLWSETQEEDARRAQHESRTVSAGQEARIDFSLLSSGLTTAGVGSFYTQHAEFAWYTRQCLHL
jgi:hypothetical protein